jgi:hypothetical protein
LFNFLTFVHILLLKVVFYKTALVKFKISNNLKQSNDETHSKLPKIHRKIQTSLWILKILRKKSKNQKSSRLLPYVCDFQNEWISMLCNFHLRRGWTWTVQKHGCQQQHEQGKDHGRQQQKDQQQKN